MLQGFFLRPEGAKGFGRGRSESLSAAPGLASKGFKPRRGETPERMDVTS